MYHIFKKKQLNPIIYDKKTIDFFEADWVARQSAGLENLPGKYTFNCPTCGKLCKGRWRTSFFKKKLYGKSGCPKCKIGITASPLR